MSDRISVGGDHYLSIAEPFVTHFVDFQLRSYVSYVNNVKPVQPVPLIIQFEELDKQLFADMMQTTGWGTSVLIVIQEDSLVVILPNLVLFIDEDDDK